MAGRGEFSEKFKPLFTPARYKVFYGGRAGGKSWSFARALLILAMQKPLRILCARELQVSISDSVHRLLADQAQEMGLAQFYEIKQASIRNKIGSEFIFKGLKHNAGEIKSMEGIDICWVEEAANVSKASWDLLVPTIRKEGSEIWISFNPAAPDGETYQRFVVHPPEGAVVVKVGWEDMQAYFPDTLRQEMEYCRATDPDAYKHIWGGEPRVISEAQIFKGKFVVEPFDTPDFVEFRYGADWGFANDPSTVVRCFVKENRLYIEYEAWAQGLELDQLPALFDTIPGTRALESEILADASRPEIIKHLRNQGYGIRGAKKWPGSVEEGIGVMRAFEKIIIHPRCRHTIDEFGLYSYKTDPTTEEILPVVLDKNNHCIDAIRYALDWVIRGKA